MSVNICIVIASKGYPDSFDKNILIENLEKFENSKDKYIFHAGTKKEDDRFYSTGGRVLNFVSVADNFKKARDECLNQIKELNWKNGHYRNDIGYRVIKN